MKLYTIIGDSQPHIPADMRLLVASGRLQTVTECCMQVGKTGPIDDESNNSAPV